jgi:hypothetical protein
MKLVGVEWLPESVSCWDETLNRPLVGQATITVLSSVHVQYGRASHVVVVDCKLSPLTDFEDSKLSNICDECAIWTPQGCRKPTLELDGAKLTRRVD